MMSTFTLTLVDVRGVQRYLFNANELKQNLGASALIEQATHDWIEDILQGCEYNHNLPQSNRFLFNIDETKRLEDSALDAEVIFMGGGNVAILFRDSKRATTFAKEYTTKILLEAPGLEVAIGHTEVIWEESGALQDAWRKLTEEIMPMRKEGRATSQPVLGLGVTTECAFTGLPAIVEQIEDGQGRLMSAEAIAKIDNVGPAKERLDFHLRIDPFKYPSAFNELGGERGHAQYLAVVHADGNGMGKRIKVSTNHPDNRKMVNQMRAYSQSINRAGLNAMKAVCDWIRITLQVDRDGEYYIEDRWRSDKLIRLKDENLPLRPIVFGGDDLTFVCDGRLGLALAAKYLEALTKETLSDGPIFACAGVVIVHSTYPFARAYALAADLAREAKHKAYEWDPDRKEVSLINWHFAPSGLMLSWKETQDREFQNGALLLRPLVVTKSANIVVEEWRTWETFTGQIKAFREPPWVSRRGKIKELGSLLREGKAAVTRFTNLNGELPKVAALKAHDADKSGWYNSRCIYFDALEAEDLFIYPKEVDHA
jgi:hypothetical protein